MSAPETEEAPARWIDRPGVRNFLGRYLIGGYIRFVRMTSRVPSVGTANPTSPLW